MSPQLYVQDWILTGHLNHPGISFHHLKLFLKYYIFLTCCIMAIRNRSVFTRNRVQQSWVFNVMNSVRSSKKSQMRVDTYQSCSAAQNDCSWYLFHDKLPQNMMLLEKKWSTLRNTQVTQLSQQLATVTQAYVYKNPHWTFVFCVRIS